MLRGTVLYFFWSVAGALLSMLKISKLADYATLIMSEFARAQEPILSASGVAETTKVPLPTVSKLLKLLQEADLLASTRGPQGGYRLARSEEAIYLSEIIAAIDGPLAIIGCMREQTACAVESHCTVKANWQVLNRKVDKLLRSVTLAEMRLELVESE